MKRILSIGKDDFYPQIFRLAVPIIIQNLLSAAVNSADVIMLNYVGQSAISAVSLAANYSKASQTSITIARGDKDQTYEEVAFNLGNDEISDVFADNNGYYILKCLNTYMESESEANKEKVARQRKTERFHAIYSDLMEDTISEFQQRMWDNIKFTDYDTVTTSNFFEVYQEYFE